MNVKKWGPGAWVYFHTLTFNYPLEPTDYDRKRYKNYFSDTQKMLPCIHCRNSYKVYIEFLPIEPFLDDRQGVTYWLYRLHDLINKKLFTDSPDFVDVVRSYEDIRAKCSKMVKDGDKEKKYNSCQMKIKTDDELIQEFAESAIAKYKLLADSMVEKLYKSPKNPNKHCNEYYAKQSDDKNKLLENNNNAQKGGYSKIISKHIEYKKLF